MSLQSFEEAMNDRVPDNEKPSILLANGFSQAWNTAIFNYKNLLIGANFGIRDTQIREIFAKFNTYDFEQVMRALEAAEAVCETYSIDAAKIDDISTDQKQLKNSLIDSISNTHPARSSSVSVAQYEKAKPFILKFKKIFTLNYDLLLYWIVNKTEIEPAGYRTGDGFTFNTWQNRSDQDVFFVHGGLHLYDTGTQIKKHTFNDDHDVSIIDKVRDNLDDGKFPLFVSEPTSSKKLERIKHNSYLNDCYKKISQLSGTLFIHGHSMADNDKHIFDQINESEVEKVFVSIFGDENLEMNRETMANARRFIHVDVEFYDASTAPIWA